MLLLGKILDISATTGDPFVARSAAHFARRISVSGPIVR